MKLNKSIKLEILICIIGLSFLLYPFISNYINQIQSSKAEITYSEEVSKINDTEYARIVKSVYDYNQELYNNGQNKTEGYENILNLDKLGGMGYINIPKINVTAKIVHGTSEESLANNVGHLDWSSLPLGGKNTHAILSAHNGLISNRLFTDLRKLEIGDTFNIHILDEVLTYKVDEIKTVKPEEVSSLKIVPGEDLVTLVTCTPYGINTDRLLVKGHRIKTQSQKNEEIENNNYGKENLIIRSIFIIIITACAVGTVILMNKNKG